MSIARIHEDPRVTMPYTDEQWQAINALRPARSTSISRRGDVRLTMGGEPTFVSIDDMEGDEWKTEALGDRTSGGWRAICSCDSSIAVRPWTADCTLARANGIPASRCRVGR